MYKEIRYHLEKSHDKLASDVEKTLTLDKHNIMTDKVERKIRNHIGLSQVLIKIEICFYHETGPVLANRKPFNKQVGLWSRAYFLVNTGASVSALINTAKYHNRKKEKERRIWMKERFALVSFHMR